MQGIWTLQRVGATKRRSLAMAIAALALIFAQSALAQGKLTPTELALVNRVTWGLNGSTVAAVEAVGMEAWLQNQLHPARLDALPSGARDYINTLDKLKMTDIDLWLLLTANRANASATTNPTFNQITSAFGESLKTQITNQQLTYYTYSDNQILETLTWFWGNHFSVNMDSAPISYSRYESDVLRPRALGKFGELLMATAKSPMMLEYLGNASSRKGKPNENYAREFLELHTMGVNSGYTQKDVQELARILTGLTTYRTVGDPKVPANLQSQLVKNGLFVFDPSRHDYGDKVLLGQTIKGTGLNELDQAVNLIVKQPATARFISTKLVKYYVNDQNPPNQLIEAMAAKFQATDGDIAEVLNLMFHAPEFTNSLATPMLKDPQHFVISAYRMAYDGRTITNPSVARSYMTRLDQGLNRRSTPDGYSLSREEWNGPGRIQPRFEVAMAIGNGNSSLFKLNGDAAQTPSANGAPSLSGAFYTNYLSAILAPTTLTALSKAKTTAIRNGFLLASPELQRR